MKRHNHLLLTVTTINFSTREEIMLKNIAKKTLAAALLASVGFAAVAQERVYVIDQRDVVAKSRLRSVLAHRLLDPGCCCRRQGRLRVRQGPDPG